MARIHLLPGRRRDARGYDQREARGKRHIHEEPAGVSGAACKTEPDKLSPTGIFEIFGLCRADREEAQQHYPLYAAGRGQAQPVVVLLHG